MGKFLLYKPGRKMNIAEVDVGEFSRAEIVKTRFFPNLEWMPDKLERRLLFDVTLVANSTNRFTQNIRFGWFAALILFTDLPAV